MRKLAMVSGIALLGIAGLNLITPEEPTQERPTDFIAGLLGRAKRNQDAHELEVLHVEDKRGTT